jgi:hypothetical protein
LYTAVVSTPANPGPNDLDEQKTGDDGQNNEQIKIFFRHCPCLPMKETEQCQCRYEKGGKIAWIGNERKGKTAGLGIGFLKSLSMANARMPQL